MRKISAVLQTASTNFNTGMHLDVYDSILFKHGIVIDTIKLYILMLV